MLPSRRSALCSSIKRGLWFPIVLLCFAYERNNVNGDNKSCPRLTELKEAACTLPTRTPLAKWEEGCTRDVTWTSDGNVLKDRTQFMIRGLETVKMRGGLVLEISPLASPILPRNYSGYRNVDVADRAGLLKKYAKHATVDKTLIAEPTYVWTGQTYAQLVGEERFDLVVASHVVEHVPDIIGFLNDISDILTDDGELRLIFPDYRFCFDWNRQPTRFSEIMSAYHEKKKKPNFADVYDYYALVHSHGVRNDPRAHWSTSPAMHGKQRFATPTREWHDKALKKMREAESVYIDVHVWRFTPALFTEYMHFATRIGILRAELMQVVETQTDDFEIFASFRKLKV